MPIQCAGKSLYLGAPDRFVGVALGLQVDRVETEPVLLDDAVDTTIAAVAGGLGCVLLTAAIAHGDHQIDHQRLKEAGSLVQDLSQQIVGKRAVDSDQGLLDLLLRRCR
ncbi:hypothetical protein D3C85_1680330 [compost metagenome]